MGHDIREIIEKVGAFTRTENLKDILGNLSTTKRLGHILGAFDEGLDPQGDIYQALGVPATNSIWSAVQYIGDVACPAAPVAGSLLHVLVEGI